MTHAKTSLSIRLQQAIEKKGIERLPHHSRVHRLRTFPGQCFVKREDELSFGISGTKLRKYLSLLPALLKEETHEAVVIGSAYSNHVLSISQLLREKGVAPILFLRSSKGVKWQGNLLNSALFAEKIHWIEGNLEDAAKAYASTKAHVAVIPQGANCAQALPGALTLALDILENEAQWGLEFDHIFIDSGTGMTATALLLAFSYLKKNCHVHILQVAGTRREFLGLLKERHYEFEELIGQTLPSPTCYTLYTPSTALSFGSTNSTVFQMIAEMAANEGFLTDPIFTAKLFYEGKKILKVKNLQGNILFLHSGGALTLSGFQEEMGKFIKAKKIE